MNTRLFLAGALLLVLPLSARAEISLIQVQGTFDLTQSEDTGGLNTFAPLLGQPFTFLYSYDPSSPDIDSFINNIGRYSFSAPPLKFQLNSNSVMLTDTSYQLSVSGPPNTARYFALGNTGFSATGLALPSDTFESNFGLSHIVSSSAVSYLNNGSGDDPLPATPFFLGEPLDNAYVFIELTNGDENGEYFEQTLNGSITSISVIPASLDGDLDGDGFVGITDLNIVLGNWNQNVAAGDPLVGDPSGDGFVGIDDLNLVLGNWNAGMPPVGSVVPEPATLSLLTIGVLILARRQR